MLDSECYVGLVRKSASRELYEEICINGKNVDKELRLFYSLVRGTRTGFNLGYDVARVLYEGICSRVMFYTCTT